MEQALFVSFIQYTCTERKLKPLEFQVHFTVYFLYHTVRITLHVPTSFRQMLLVQIPVVKWGKYTLR